MKFLLLFAFFALITFCSATPKYPEHINIFHGEGCSADDLFVSRFKPQIAALAPDVERILQAVLAKGGPQAGKTYSSLATFVDRFGPRMTGSQSLEDAIDYMITRLKKEGHQNVHGEEVSVPVWTRGREWAEMVAPRHKRLPILGLGYSVGTTTAGATSPTITGNRTLEAPVLVVRSFEELQRRAAEVAGKIVVFNYHYSNYSAGKGYRMNGASMAAKHGAVAALIRSVTPLSIASPHTGALKYQPNVVKIPGVSITVEDAEMFQRLADRKEHIIVRLYSENALSPKAATSRNTVSELVGSRHPEQVVLVSGHLDSWDVGQGAMDDGAGAFISWRALSVVKQLGLVPKRTLRSVLWTAEEMGLLGAKEYAKRHQKSLRNISIALESDEGTFEPIGLSYSGLNHTAHCVLHSILQMVGGEGSPLLPNSSQLSLRLDGSDVTVLARVAGVPVASLDNANERYFYYHHTQGDTMSVLDSGELDRCTAFWAAVGYALAALEDPLPL